jgi:proteasome lid subunit RPN8/RPN11
MTTSPTHVLPSQQLSPRLAPLPVDQAHYWASPFEEPQFHPALSVFVTRDAYTRLVTHAASELDYEVGGILVGDWCADVVTGQQFIVVESSLPARFTRQGASFLTFTQDSLVDFHTVLDEKYPDKQIIGWYHTHPRMGVFLSHYDTWLHHHFFPEPWQVALVIEPLSSSGGFFIRQADGLLDPGRYFGFYELGGDSGQSIVNWSNLSQGLVKTGEQGVDSHE